MNFAGGRRKDMNYVEYGKENHDVIILLHGGGLSWWNYREAAQILQSDYRVILPILDGHAGSERAFTTIEAHAAELIEFIDARFGGSVLLMGGLSLGAQILLEVLSQRRDICRYALIESALVLPSKVTHTLIKPVFGGCYGLIRYRWFSRLQFKSLRIKQELFEEYFRDTCSISKADMITFLQANASYTVKASLEDCMAKAYIFVGARENRAMRKSSKIIHEKLTGSVRKILPNMYHGEFSINRAGSYVNTILEIIEKG